MFEDTIRLHIQPATWAVVGITHRDGGSVVQVKGTAFAVDARGHLVTCWHSLHSDGIGTPLCDAVYVYQPPPGESALRIVDVLTLHRVDAVVYSESRDLVLLKIEDAAVRTTPVRFKALAPSIGTSCCTLGYPLSTPDESNEQILVHTTAVAGAVVSHRRQVVIRGAADAAVFELGMRTDPGASGGAVFLRSGEVFGVLESSTLLDDGRGNRQRSEFSIAISAAEVLQFLKAHWNRSRR